MSETERAKARVLRAYEALRGVTDPAEMRRISLRLQAENETARDLVEQVLDHAAQSEA